LEAIEPGIIALLVLVAGVAGLVDAIAGGGGLLCLPALLAAGLSPAQALATNKLQGSFGTFSSTLHFIRQGRIDLFAMRWLVFWTMLGAIAGTALVQSIDQAFMARIVPWLLACAAFYFLFSPRLGDEDAHRRVGEGLFALIFGLTLGFYDGFFGPGTGSFWVLALVALQGDGLIKATAKTKLVNFTSNIVSLFVFILGGQVVWTVGLAMAIGQLIGGRVGASLVLSRGASIVRPMLVIVSLAITAKLLLGRVAI
jgi:uncharacterized membrane protein YfcA